MTQAFVETNDGDNDRYYRYSMDHDGKNDETYEGLTIPVFLEWNRNDHNHGVDIPLVRQNIQYDFYSSTDKKSKSELQSTMSKSKLKKDIQESVSGSLYRFIGPSSSALAMIADPELLVYTK